MNVAGVEKKELYIKVIKNKDKMTRKKKNPD